MRMLFALLWAPAAARELSITDFGAVPGGANNATAAFENGKALYDALRAARKGDVVVVPSQRFVMVPYAPLYGLEHVELRLEGCLAAYEPPQGEHAKVWPFYLGNFESLITIHLSSHVTVSGGGALDGRGHNWWVAFARNKLASKRPMLLQIDGSTDIVVRDITMLDSPRFNLYLGSYCKRVLVERVTILADWAAQAALQKSVPMFPFNTDGIDVAGRDVTIRDIVVSNYDDVVAVKAADLLSDKTGAVPGCTQNVTIYNTTVYRGAGLSIGSVHPSPLKPCVGVGRGQLLY
uniref:Pectate lyase superfamily protein domain-containing protein n=1 Tax=Pelagomonas calceolata TaxID=35677 RepID=A0A7S3ZP07_9STRA|mmetsp:Transcript_17312/g.49441  ORF Transcript_17312/g.49441 Transcript_17312/m.49441 type:complete len:292 (-) Transcript_17312:124-999(-)